MLLGKWRPATVVEIHISSGELHGYEIRFDAENNRPPEEYTVGNTVARGIRPVQGGGNAVPPRGNPVRVLPTPRPGDGAAEPDAPVQGRTIAKGACSSDPLLTADQKPTDSMDLSFKRAILGNYQKKVSETGLSTPLAVGVTYDNFQVGRPRTNRRTLDRTDGAYMRSAPVGADIYPVKTRFTECERFRNEIIRTVVDGRYECFKDNFGEWACGNASGWRTLDTQREILTPQ